MFRGPCSEPPEAKVRAMMRVKVCCIASVAEARMAARAGASAVGLVSAMPSGPGVIDEAKIAEIASTVPPGVATFLLTSRTDAAGIIAQQRRCGVNTLQLCDRVDAGVHEALREALPGVGLVQVIHVVGEASVGEALDATDRVDALLLDSGDPAKSVKQLGGTGRVHDWSLSRRIVEAVGKPVYLAGGLRAENAGEAIAAVRPFGLDLCSGVREGDRLHEGRLRAFMSAVREADPS